MVLCASCQDFEKKKQLIVKIDIENFIMLYLTNTQYYKARTLLSPIQNLCRSIVFELQV